jgi:hypothetical protein
VDDTFYVMACGGACGDYGNKKDKVVAEPGL